MFAISNRWNVGTSCGLNGGVGSTRPRVAWRGKVMFTPKTFNDISWHRLIYTDIIWLYLIPIIGLERTPKFLVMFLHGRNKHIFFLAWKDHTCWPSRLWCLRGEYLSRTLSKQRGEKNLHRYTQRSTRICHDVSYSVLWHIVSYSGILWNIWTFYMS